VLEALILEAELIKKYQPKYNTKEKDNKSFNFVIITDEDYPRIFTIRGRELEDKKIRKEFKIKYQFGPFVNGTSLREALSIVRRIFPYRDTKCIPQSGTPCFNYQIGLCPGVCVNAITKTEYSKHIRHIVLFFKGKKTTLIKQLTKEMQSYAQKLEFEKSLAIKKQLFALSHIKDSSLIREDFHNESLRVGEENGTSSEIFRTEAYDVSHLQGTHMTGVMVVIENGMLKKSDYRMFKIKRKGINDVLSLKEILTRRFNHPEWRLPNLIVVDGGVAQLSVAREVLEEKGLAIDLVAVTKNEKHKPKAIIGNSASLEKELKQRTKEILLANSEAHRFTLKYHRKLGLSFYKDLS